MQNNSNILSLIILSRLLISIQMRCKRQKIINVFRIYLIKPDFIFLIHTSLLRNIESRASTRLAPVKLALMSGETLTRKFLVMSQEKLTNNFLT